MYMCDLEKRVQLCMHAYGCVSKMCVHELPFVICTYTGRNLAMTNLLICSTK